MFSLMLLPFLMCVVLTGIHVFFGIHIIRRNIIFVDLALAQFAALGYMVALYLGVHEAPLYGYGISLSFTLLGALFFTISRRRLPDDLQEAVIGISYAITTAFSILIISNTATEGHHLQTLLVGNILFVDWKELAIVSLIYSAIGLFHFIFHDRFHDLSKSKTMSSLLWDFLFYASFGIVVTSSVKVAGVLLVFSLLVIPVFVARLYTNDFRSMLIAGWTLGILGCIKGILASVAMDLPTGAAIVANFSIIVILGVLGKQLRQAK